MLRVHVLEVVLFFSIAFGFGAFDCGNNPPIPAGCNNGGGGGGGGSIYSVFAESHNGGSTWVLTDSLYFAEGLYAGSYTFAGGVYVIAGKDTALKATIWRSTDSGFRWTPVLRITATVDLFLDITHTSGYARLVAVTSDGHVYMSSNVGASWTQVVSGGGSPLRAADFFEQTDIGVAVGNGGHIIRSTDGGSTWTPVGSGTTQILYGVHCISSGPTSETIIAVGQAGTVVRSTDAGITWAVSNLPTTQTLNCVSFSENASGRFGMAMGNGGAAFKTTDDGVSWQPKSVGGTVGNLEDVIISSSGDRCLTISALGGLTPTQFWISTDGGESWQYQTEIPHVYLHKLVYRTLSAVDYGFVVGVPN